MKLKRLIANGVKWYNRHDRTVLTGISMAATVIAVVEAWRVRPRCEAILEEMNEKGAGNAEKAKALGKEVVKVAVPLGVALVAHGAEYKKTGEKLSSAYNAISTYKTVDDIRKEVMKDELGKEKVEEIDKKVAKQELESAVKVEGAIQKTGHGDTLFIEDDYANVMWRGSKDYWDLTISECNRALQSCYDKYTGLCVRDDFALSIRDIIRRQGLKSAKVTCMFEFSAREFKELPISLEPVEVDTPDGGTELAYHVRYDESPTFAYTSMYRG